ncbi:atypical kinase COQ8B, mitochondrial [Musca vetustissima]|uniref:atypical kinase COQ8B, mitochondrial n=1 Tax=Musca vetustissima TaxID=27455 RepID=UPI002AB6A876|nr:atypical kinase COQ8B, mitochondrial [Musca vetustissima]
MSKAGSDILAVLRGLQIVLEQVQREHRELSRHLWANSSIRELLEENLKLGKEYLQKTGQNPTEELKKLQQLLQETRERSCVVVEGVKQLTAAKIATDFKMTQMPSFTSAATSAGEKIEQMMSGRPGEQMVTHSTVDSQQRVTKEGKLSPLTAAGKIDAANLDISSITLKEMEEILSRRLEIRKRENMEQQKQETKTESTSSPNETTAASYSTSSSTAASSTSAPVTDSMKADSVYVKNMLSFVAGAPAEGTTATSPNSAQIELPSLTKVSKQRKVPSSRIGRMASFGGLFAGLGIGTINELTKGALGLGGSTNVKDALLSPANADRIVDTLCKVRGAALKIGQILSIQDSKVVSPQLAKAFERVRQSADYMPDWQVERVMNTELGPQWRDLFASFEDKPFAAASIGQVHRGVLKNGMHVAVKIQYPGVAKSIESDIDNLVGMLKVWDVFPKGFFIDNLVKVAKRELNWEVDYTREADYTEKFKEMIAPYGEYYAPLVIRDITTSSVLTTELVPGVPLDKCFEMSYDHRRHIGESVLKLCLRELFEFQCMQTDPNWSNFLYDANSRRLMLIDFGSTRFYQKEFIKKYRSIIMCAVNNDRKGVLEISREMGFLTSYETKLMEEAHVDAVMILGEMFRCEGEFDFGKQNTTERLANLVPTMVAHRLCPPPEEIYSIHRKLSGIFLLCSRLNIRLECRPLYDDIVVGKFRK